MTHDVNDVTGIMQTSFSKVKEQAVFYNFYQGTFFEETGTPIIHVVVVQIQCHNTGSHSPSDAYITKS